MYIALEFDVLKKHDIYRNRDKYVNMATGFYHKYNFALFRILEAFVKSDKDVLTCQDIANITGMDKANVSRNMNHYMGFKLKYFRRLPKRDYHYVRYKISRAGILKYTQCLKRIKLGFGLNCMKQIPSRMSTYKGLKQVSLMTEEDRILNFDDVAPYYGITLYGSKIGIQSEYIKKVSKLT